MGWSASSSCPQCGVVLGHPKSWEIAAGALTIRRHIVRNPGQLVAYLIGAKNLHPSRSSFVVLT